jgi:hypothetical protein
MLMVAVSLVSVVVYALVLCGVLVVFNLLGVGHLRAAVGTLAVCVAIEFAQAAIYRGGAFNRLTVQIWLVFVLIPGLAMFAVSRLELFRTGPFWLAAVGPVCYAVAVVVGAMLQGVFATARPMR